MHVCVHPYLCVYTYVHAQTLQMPCRCLYMCTHVFVLCMCVRVGWVFVCVLALILHAPPPPLPYLTTQMYFQSLLCNDLQGGVDSGIVSVEHSDSEVPPGPDARLD